jgi:hypothetical protein
MDHTHSWEPYASKGLGIWEKRDCPGNQAYFEGRVTKCECGVMMFFPNKKDLSAVEVAIEKEI